MKEYQHKHMVRTLVYSKATMVILFLLIVLLLRSIMELNDKRLNVDKLRNDSERERKELEEKVSVAKKQNELIKTEKGFESYVRTTYPVVKEGEGVIVIYDDEKMSVSEVRDRVRFWERVVIFWNGLFNK